MILAVYGAEKYIEECLLSLFNQTKTDGVEFILVNDCTPDDSMVVAQRVIDQFPTLNIRVINHDVNSGVAITRQTGLDAAVGEYIIYVDPDDWCELTMLTELYNMAQSKDADIVCCDFYENYHNRESYIKCVVSEESLQNIDRFLVGGVHASLCNKLIRRGILSSNRISFIPRIDIWEDLLVCVKCFVYATKVIYTPKAYLHYRQSSTSLTHTIPPQRIDNKIAVVAEFERFFKEVQLEDLVRDTMIKFKIKFKLYLMRQSDGDRQVSYSKLYHELDKYVDSHLKERSIHKFAYKQAVSGRLPIFNLIYWALGVKKKISNRKSVNY